MIHPVPHPKMVGQESVWDFPRPAIAEQVPTHLKIMHRGMIIAETRHGVRTLETSHPPGYYLPREDVAMALLATSENRSFCEWKGNATYFDISVKGETLRAVAWSYPNPTTPFLVLGNYISFYAAPFDDCFVDGEKVVPQPGAFMAAGSHLSSQVHLRVFPAANFGNDLKRPIPNQLMGKATGLPTRQQQKTARGGASLAQDKVFQFQ